jgi:hypothetical protein
MTSLNIELIEKGDVHPNQEGLELNFEKMIIYEGGTSGGRTAVALYFTDMAGDKYFALTTARIVANGMGGAIKGAMARWGDDINKP